MYFFLVLQQLGVIFLKNIVPLLFSAWLLFCYEVLPEL